MCFDTHVFSLVTVADFDALGAVLSPSEAYPPLSVDADAVLSFSVAAQKF